MITNLRFIERNGEKVLQAKSSPNAGIYGEGCVQWQDVSLEEEEKKKSKLKFEVGKFYKTRDGEKALCVDVRRWCHYPIIFYIYFTEELRFCTTKGAYDEAFSSEKDIIGEWLEQKKEPLKVEMWVNIDADGDKEAFHTEECANQYANDNTIACVKLTGEYTHD